MVYGTMKLSCVIASYLLLCGTIDSCSQDLRVSPDDDGKAPVGGILPGRVDLDPYAIVCLGDQVLLFSKNDSAESE